MRMSQESKNKKQTVKMSDNIASLRSYSSPKLEALTVTIKEILKERNW
jgi:hypothetical protein